MRTTDMASGASDAVSESIGGAFSTLRDTQSRSDAV